MGSEYEPPWWRDFPYRPYRRPPLYINRFQYQWMLDNFPEITEEKLKLAGFVVIDSDYIQKEMDTLSRVIKKLEEEEAKPLKVTGTMGGQTFEFVIDDPVLKSAITKNSIRGLSIWGDPNKTPELETDLVITDAVAFRYRRLMEESNE